MNYKNHESVRLGLLINSIYAGGTPSTVKQEYWKNGNIPWMSSGEIHKRRIYSVEKKITDLGLKNSSTKYVPVNSVLIALAGQGKTRGTVAINKIPLCTNQSIASIQTNEKILHYEYLYYYLQYNYENIRNLSSGDGGRGGLNLEILRSYKIKLVKIEKQLEYSRYLNLIDNLIKSHDIKINRLRSVTFHYINYYFNNLDQDTVEYNLSELVDSSRGKGISKDDLNENGKYKCILYGELFTKYSSVISNVKSRTDSTEGINSIGNEVLLPSSTTTGAREIAIASALVEKNVKIGSDVIILRCKETVYNQYLAYHLRYYSWKDISKVAVGITIIHLYAKDIMDISVKVPTLEKQKVFVNMLSSMDKLIEIEEKKLEKLELMKKYYLKQIFQ